VPADLTVDSPVLSQSPPGAAAKVKEAEADGVIISGGIGRGRVTRQAGRRTAPGAGPFAEGDGIKQDD
jgi:hypothetical protein